MRACIRGVWCHSSLVTKTETAKSQPCSRARPARSTCGLSPMRVTWTTASAPRTTWAAGIVAVSWARPGYGLGRLHTTMTRAVRRES